jgi:hypothetical protein
MGEDWQDASWFYSGERTPCAVVTSKFDCPAIAQLQRRAADVQSDLVTFRTGISTADAVSANQLLSDALDRYARSVRDERPTHYYVVARARYLVRLLRSSSTHRMFGDYATMNPRLRPFRAGVDIIWWIMEALFFGLIVRRLFSLGRSPTLVLIAVTVVYFYGVYAIVFAMNDFRYLVPVAPLLVAAIACLSKFGELAASARA